MGTLLKFPEPKATVDEHTLETYAELIAKRGAIAFNQERILDNLEVNRLFSGCHTMYGELNEKIYKLLLAFNNSPTKENWDMVKNYPIFGRTTALDIMQVFEQDYNNPELEPTLFPEIESFKLYFVELRQAIILKNATVLSIYNAEIDKIETNYPAIKDIF